MPECWFSRRQTEQTHHPEGHAHPIPFHRGRGFSRLSQQIEDHGGKLLAAENIRPKIAVLVLGLSQGGYPQPTRSGPSAEHGFGMAVGNRRRVLDGGDFFLKSILFVTF